MTPKSSKLALALLILAGAAGNAIAANNTAIQASKARVISHWTPERLANAIPRDLVIDPRGLGYLKHPNGALEPYGHKIAAANASNKVTPSPFGKPSGGSSGGTSDATGPSISGMTPANGTTISANQTFSAVVTDPSGVNSVTVKIRKGSATAQSFVAKQVTGSDTWSVDLQGFTDGSWSWWIEARDKVGKRGNLTTSPTYSFSVSTSTSGGGGDVITNSRWSAGGAIQTAAGRIYFEMPYNGGWGGFVCSGTVAVDDVSGRSVIQTAAHCVYDDANKVFARNVIFIPNQDASSSGTDLNCSNDPLGCWVPSFGVVDTNWSLYTFPDNIRWDYAYYIVNDTGSHQGSSASSDALDVAAGALPISFDSVFHDVSNSSADYTHALGYSQKDDPNFMYCAEDLTSEGSYDWWLPNCGLSGGASGGPWIQPMDLGTGSGQIISINSWGYVDRQGNPTPGMAGPFLFGTSASCVFATAKTAAYPGLPANGGAGITAACP